MGPKWYSLASQTERVEAEIITDKYWQIQTLNERLAKQRRSKLFSDIGCRVWN